MKYKNIGEVNQMRKKLKVLIVASEAGPFIKSGGLGDVAGALPVALKEKDIDVRLVIPRYRDLKEEHLSDVEYIGDIDVFLGWRDQRAKILRKPSDVPVYFIENDYYFSRNGLYGFGDDNERFAFFSKVVLELLEKEDFFPDIIHCNDWQTAAVCMYLKELYSKTVYYANIKTLYTIHNLQYQGNFNKDTFEVLGVSGYCYGNIEFHDAISFMKMGLIYSDAISTVSNTYAQEIQGYEFGYGMDGVLRSRNYVLSGILNGIDTVHNDPANDPRIPNHYTIDNLEGKRENKRWLQEKLGFEVNEDIPVIGMITRLADQKGLDLLVGGFHEIMKQGAQFVIIGTGEPRFEWFFRDMEQQYPDQVRAKIFFDEGLAQKVYSGSDFFLMPSRFEPCGLGQMFSLRYGTVPIVRKTGGLADTVFHFDPETGEGNGFLFETYDIGGMLWAVNEGIQVFRQGREVWDKVVRNALASDYSMDKMATQYIQLYYEIMKDK